MPQARAHSIAQLKLLRAAKERIRAREQLADVNGMTASAGAVWSEKGGRMLKKLTKWLEKRATDYTS